MIFEKLRTFLRLRPDWKKLTLAALGLSYLALLYALIATLGITILVPYSAGKGQWTLDANQALPKRILKTCVASLLGSLAYWVTLPLTLAGLAICTVVWPVAGVIVANQHSWDEGIRAAWKFMGECVKSTIDMLLYPEKAILKEQAEESERRAFVAELLREEKIREEKRLKRDDTFKILTQLTKQTIINHAKSHPEDLCYIFDNELSSFSFKGKSIETFREKIRQDYLAQQTDKTDEQEQLLSEFEKYNERLVAVTFDSNLGIDVSKCQFINSK